MKTTEYIKLFDQTIIGIIETDRNGDQIARDFPGNQILGYYRAKTNFTTDFYGRMLSEGNTVISLIYNKHNGK